MQPRQRTGTETAIVGMSALFPSSEDLQHWWSQLRDGKELVSFFTNEELLASGVQPELLQHPKFVKAGCPLKRDISLFDAGFFGFTPREAEIMDPQQRLFLEHAYWALETAGYAPDTFAGRIGVFAGQSLGSYFVGHLLPNRGLLESVPPLQVISANDKDFLPTHVAYKLNLKGPAVNVQTACSTGLVAVHLACQSLILGECDMAIAGSVSLHIPQVNGYGYQEAGINSIDGHCRPFDANATGTVFGSGVAVVVLKRLSEAMADHDAIDAVILGSALNNDGSAKVGYTAPGLEGQAQVIAEAQRIAGVSADSISYVETHGTGTNLGDPIEVAALTQAFRASTERKGYCALASVKSNMGHLDTVAGMAGLVKTVLQLKHREIVPSINFEKPNPNIDFANSPFYVNAALRKWESDSVRRAGVSSFGIGGTNAHVVLEEAPENTVSTDSRPWHMLVLSAKSPTALDAATRNLATFLSEHPDVNLADASYTLQVGRSAFKHRRAVICRDVADAVTALNNLDPHRTVSGIKNDRRRIAFMFPGQGSQHINMGRELYLTEATFRETVDECCELLRPELGLDLRDLLYPPAGREQFAEKQLTATSITQPAMFVIEYALARLWREWGIEPDVMIGHSIGEWVAACIAGVMTLQQTLALVAARGRLMQSMPSGAMLSVAAAEQDLQRFLCSELSLAAVNAPKACVLSGTEDAIAQAERELGDAGVQCRRLRTSHAFHSPSMEGMLGEFSDFIAKVPLNPPRIPFISNLSGTWIRDEEATSPNYWARHLRQCVRFADGLNKLVSDNRILLEVGPGQALTSLARQTRPKPEEVLIVSSMRHAQEERSDIECLLSALGRIWTCGYPINWNGFYAREQRCRISLPTYPFERQRYWIEASSINTASQVPSALVKKNSAIENWFYSPSWQQAAPFRLLQRGSVESDANWLIFEDDLGIGATLARDLHAAGYSVTRVRSGEAFCADSEAFVMNPARPEDYDQLFMSLSADGRKPDAIAHLWTITNNTAQPLTPESFDQAQRIGFHSITNLVRAATTANCANLQITIVSNQVQEVHGDEPLAPEKTPALAACVVLPQEYPTISCRSVDVELGRASAESIAAQLATEITSDVNDVFVAHRGSNRWVLDYKPVALQPASDTVAYLRDGIVLLITGGLGNIGLTLAQWAARTAKDAKIALVARTKLPPEPEWAAYLQNHSADDGITRRIRRLQQIQELGSSLLVVNADVSEVDQLRAAIHEVHERFGPINGVFHAAGSINPQAFSFVQDLRAEHCDMHFRPKVLGTLALEEALRDEHIEFCNLFSSVSVQLGGLGYMPYAASNFFLDAFTRKHNRQNGKVWSSVNWDAWNFGDQTTSNTATDKLLSLTITPQEGVEALHRVLSRPPVSQLIVCTSDLKARIERSRNNRPEPSADDSVVRSADQHDRPQLQVQYACARHDLDQALIDIWQNVLGIDGIGIHDNFFDLGGHSLLATQVLTRISDLFNLSLPMRAIFEAPTIAEIADRMLATDSQSDRLQKVATVLVAVERMSADEIDQALNQHGGAVA